MIPFSLGNELRAKAAIVGALLLVLGVALYLGNFVPLPTKNDPAAVASADALHESDPVRLRIPKLLIDTNFVPLGLMENGEIEVPAGYTEVGWYTYGPTPGELGPAVVLGHVDSKTGPGVFMFLGQLAPGDLIHVDRNDGSVATFRVTSLERYNRDEFPTEKIYGNIPYAGIRLITCSGFYDRASERYDRVLVVYGELVPEDDEEEGVVE